MYEWPTGCTLWKDKRVVDMISRFVLQKVNLNGCMLGLTSIEGKLMKKRWTLMSNLPKIVSAFYADICDGSHEHQVIQGKNTSRTSIYPWMMTDKVHQSINQRLDSDAQASNQKQIKISLGGKGGSCCQERGKPVWRVLPLMLLRLCLTLTIHGFLTLDVATTS